MIDRGRVRKTWRLAETLLDYLPEARQPSSTLGTLPGLAESRRVPCTACGARGRLRGPGTICASCPPQTSPLRVAVRREAQALHGCYPCPVCDGTGWRRRRKSDPKYDSMAGVPVPAQDDPDDISVGAIRRALAEDKARPELGYAALTRATAAVNAHDRPEEDRYAWEVAWERMCKTGSYAELVVALELLRMKAQPRYSIIWQKVCLHQPIELSDGRQAFLNQSMVYLTVFMPEQIRLPRYLRDEVAAKAKKHSLQHGKGPAHARERLLRDQEIVQRRAEGEKIARLCRDYALSRMTIHRIISKAKEPEENEPVAC